MKKIIIAFVFISQLAVSQDKGTVTGLLMDGEIDNEPLPFANVFIKGTTIGGTTDFDGKYSISVETGNHTLVFSFIGYETIERDIIVKSKETLVVNQELNVNEGVALDEVEIKATTNRTKVSVLLLEQKKAVSIKTSIGSQELEIKGISDVATAITKVTGVSKEEGSSNIFVRGLGDRYNSTTLNGLPLPSNNPSKKNITLDIFSTDIVQSIDINKVYNSKIYGDFGGANINIVSKEHIGKPFLKIGIGSGVNSNNSKESSFFLQNGPDLSGFYNTKYPANVLSEYNFSTSWGNVTKSPINASFSVKGGKKFEIGENGSLNLFATASFSNDFKFKEGIIKGSVNAQGLARTNYTFKSYKYETNTTGMLNLSYKNNDYNTYKFNSLFINSSNQKLDEYNGIIDFFGDASNGGGFVKRATFDRTYLFINQLLGSHNIKENIDVEWGISYNKLSNIIPDRRQNTLVLS